MNASAAMQLYTIINYKDKLSTKDYSLHSQVLHLEMKHFCGEKVKMTNTISEKSAIIMVRSSMLTLYLPKQ